MTEDEVKACLMFDIFSQFQSQRWRKLKIQQNFNLSHFFDTEK